MRTVGREVCISVDLPWRHSVYVAREDGRAPDAAFRFPVEYHCDDSESDVESGDTHTAYIKPSKQAEEDDEDAVPTIRSQRSWARRGCNSPPPFQDAAADFAQLLGPAYYHPGTAREAASLPRPDGAVVTRFLRVPGELRHYNMNL